MKSLVSVLAVVAVVGATAAQDGRKYAPWANKFFTASPETPPPTILKDFGTVQQGTVLTYRFKMKNIYSVPVQIERPKPASKYVVITQWTSQLGPLQAGFIDVVIYTDSIAGEKEIKLPVEFSGGDLKTVERAADPKARSQFFSQADLAIRFVSEP